jgi:hypothetical protein
MSGPARYGLRVLKTGRFPAQREMPMPLYGHERRVKVLEHLRAKDQRDRLAAERDAVRERIGQEKRKFRSMERLVTVRQLEERYRYLSSDWAMAVSRVSALERELAS